MARTDFGYDPIRMTALETNTGAAVAALRSISSSDPSAQRAIADVQSTAVDTRDRLAAGDPSDSRQHRAHRWRRGPDARWRRRRTDHSWFRIPTFPLVRSDVHPVPRRRRHHRRGDRREDRRDPRAGDRHRATVRRARPILGRALAEIADDPDLSAEFLVAIGRRRTAGALHRTVHAGIGVPACPIHERPVGPDASIGTNLERHDRRLVQPAWWPPGTRQPGGSPSRAGGDRRGSRTRTTRGRRPDSAASRG